MSTLSRHRTEPRVWRQTAIITAAAIAAYVGFRNLPLASGSLHYTDFHAGQKSFLEFCEPGSPQFAPVEKVRSPVEMTIAPASAPVEGEPVTATLTLTASSGKPVGEADLLVVHTERLHLLLVDPSLDDYHHVHPTPTGVPGEYSFSFTPRSHGRYRAFGDFTPRATGRALYSGTSIEVRPVETVDAGNGSEPNVDPRVWSESNVGDYAFHVSASAQTLRINQTTDLILKIDRPDGGPVELEDIMGAKAHLVAFDGACSGFAHLHPKDAVPSAVSRGQELAFTLNVAEPGYYRLWAQVKLDGQEVFAPFGLKVEP